MSGKGSRMAQERGFYGVIDCICNEGDEISVSKSYFIEWRLRWGRIENYSALDEFLLQMSDGCIA